MNSNNNIAIISNSNLTIQDIENMLVLLREIDKVEAYEYFRAKEKLRENTPSVIIIHSADDTKETVKLIKDIKSDELLINIPIILYTEIESTDFVIETYDLGITDIIFAPLRDYELIVRVIWAIQQNNAYEIENIKNRFLTKIDVIDKETGFYKSNYSMKFLETIIDYAKENKQNTCLMLVKITPKRELDTTEEEFAKILKSTVRLNDTVIIKDFDKYYVLLLKTKLNGIYSVYKRILPKIGSHASVSASVVEVKEEDFESIIKVLDYNLDKAYQDEEIIVAKEQDYVDMYDTEDKQKISKIFKDNNNYNTNKIIDDDFNIIDELNNLEHSETKQKDKKRKFSLKSSGKKVNKINFNKEELLKDIDIKKPSMSEIKEDIKDEEKATDRRTALLYKQSWARKLKLVCKPMFEKYAAKFQTKYPTLDANLNVSSHHSFLKFDKDDIRLNFEIFYCDLKTINFKIAIYAAKTKLEQDSFDFEVMDFDLRKLDIILKTITDEYNVYIQK